MKISAAYPSKYLKAADLQDKHVNLIMKMVELENLGDGEEKKPVLYFTNARKGLCLNKTNARVIAAAYGDNTDDWENKPIIIFSTIVDFRGDQVEAIRVKIPKAAAAPKPAPRTHDELDPPQTSEFEDIPF